MAWGTLRLIPQPPEWSVPFPGGLTSPHGLSPSTRCDKAARGPVHTGGPGLVLSAPVIPLVLNPVMWGF